jgi:hypothetical protein
MKNKTSEGIDILMPSGKINNISLEQARSAVKAVKEQMERTPRTLSQEFEGYSEIIMASMESMGLEQVYVLEAKKDLALFKMNLQELEKFKADTLKKTSKIKKAKEIKE